MAGFTALAKYREIGLATAPGRTYVLLTIATCVSGLFIFRHGTFGVPHAIAVLTLIVLILAIAAEKRAIFGRLSRYVSVVGYSATLFLDMIPRSLRRQHASRPVLRWLPVRKRRGCARRSASRSWCS